MENKAEVLKVVEDYINSAYDSDGATMRKIFDDDGADSHPPGTKLSCVLACTWNRSGKTRIKL